MDPFRKSALLWGVVGALTYLVLHQAWVARRGAFTSMGVMLGVALVVGGVTATLSYYGERRLAVRNENV